MPSDQEIIGKVITSQEIEDLKRIIKENKECAEDKVVDEYQDWYSDGGEIFECTRTVDKEDYVFQMDQDGGPDDRYSIRSDGR